MIWGMDKAVGVYMWLDEMPVYSKIIVDKIIIGVYYKIGEI